MDSVGTAFCVEEGEEVNSWEGVVVLHTSTTQSYEGHFLGVELFWGKGCCYHLATCVSQVLEGLNALINLWVEGSGERRFGVHEEIGYQVQNFRGHAEKRGYVFPRRSFWLLNYTHGFMANWMLPRWIYSQILLSASLTTRRLLD